MRNNKRRKFIKNTSALALGLLSTPHLLKSYPSANLKRKFLLSISPGAIGVKGDAMSLLKLAAKNGFQAIVPDAQSVGKMSEKERSDYTAFAKENKISWGSAGLPMDFRKDEKSYKEALAKLPEHAKNLSNIGVSRMSTWIMPTHKELTYRENFAQHTNRLKPVANILGQYGIRFGLEYVGPKTLMARDKFPFIKSMKETKELLYEIDEKNVGFVLDSFHWYCAEESMADILTLENEDIITVDLNDATAGRTPAEQIDNQRELPLNSGVIDVKQFLTALIQIGYDGPVRAEPFNAILNELNNEEAVQATYKAMSKAFALVD